MKPKVIIHNTISLDGRMDYVHIDEGLYYLIAERFNAQAILSGSETILAAYPIAATDAGDEPQKLPEKAPDTTLLLVVVDSRGRLINLHRLRRDPALARHHRSNLACHTFGLYRLSSQTRHRLHPIRR